MKSFCYIYTEDEHKWGVVAKDPQKPAHVIDTNEYIIKVGSDYLLMDPGGVEIFPAVFSSLSTEINPTGIRYIFASHQDPDIISSLSLWLEINPEIKCFVSYLWSTFIPHFGGTESTFLSLPDQGDIFHFNNVELQFIPAHYLHSSGNFHLYDKKARILYSGDVGAALIADNSNQKDLFVEDFDSHIPYTKKFHQRWMCSNEAKRKWCERVAQIEIDLLCPQHGLIYSGKDVERFINWFDELEVGITED